MNNKQLTMITLAVLLVATTTTTPVLAQQPLPIQPFTELTPTTTTPEEEATTTAAGGELYTDEENGFRFQLPAGWVAEDVQPEEISDDALNLLDEIQRYGITICPEELAQQVIGGGFDCTILEGSGLFTMSVSVYDFDLLAADEFRNVIAQGRNITTDDLLIAELQKARGPENLIGSQLENVDVQAINEIDRTTNLVNEDGEVISSDVSVKEVQYTYRSYVAEANNLPTPDEIRTRMFVVYNNPDGVQDTSDVRAYMIQVGFPSTEGETVQDSPPGEALQRAPVRTVFDSFELIE